MAKHRLNHKDIAETLASQCHMELTGFKAYSGRLSVSMISKQGHTVTLDIDYPDTVPDVPHLFASTTCNNKACIVATWYEASAPTPMHR